MVSKNNKVKKFEQSAQRQNHFSIRKLTVGAASVLLGTSLYFGTQTSQAHAAVNSESDVKATQVAKSAATESSAAAAKSSAANSVTTSSAASSAVSSAASSAVSSAASQASSAALSSAANSVATSSAASKDTETTTLKIETKKDANKVDAKKLVKAVKESKAATTDSTSGVNPLSVLEDYDDDNWDGTEDPGQPGEDGIPDVWQKNYHVKVTMINALTGEVMDPMTSGDPNFFEGLSFNKDNWNNTHLTPDQITKIAKPENNTGIYNDEGLAIKAWTNFSNFAPSGWKLLNPEEVTKYFQVTPKNIVAPEDIQDMLNWGQAPGENSAYITAKKDELILKTMNDVDMTLYYAPISPIEIKYVAEEQDEAGNPVEKTLVTYNVDSSQLNIDTNQFGDLQFYPINEDYEQASKEYSGLINEDGYPAAKITSATSPINAYALDIPGFEIVGNPTWSGVDTQTVTKDGTNPLVVTFKYKKTSQNEDSKSLNGGTLLPDDESVNFEGTLGSISYDKYENYKEKFNSSATLNEKYPGLEEALQSQVETWKNQGYSVLANTGSSAYKGTDVIPSSIGKGNTYVVPNRGVKVRYVDQDGNQLADDVILASNPHNPDQTNQGVNPTEYWYPEGDWTAPKKNITGYHLSKTYGEDHGKFMPWAYEVTFEYAKNESNVPGDAPTVTNPEAAVITVNYIDQSDNNKVLASEKLAGADGSAIDTNSVDTKITDYENQGYVLVSNGLTEAGKDFTADNNGKTYDVIFKHGTTPINPNHPGIPGEPITTPEGPKYPEGTSKEDLEKTVTRTITYVVNGEAQDKPFVAPETVTQNIKFTAEGTIDNVTGNLVTVDAAGNITSQDGKLTWTPEEGTLKAVNSPVVNYYHVVSVSADSKDNVNVDAATVNHDSNNINVVVTYAPNGHIIPVDPNGHEIPDVPPTDLPPYPTDPTNPSKVVPNVPIPEVPGYVPDKPNKDHNVPTPPNPGDNVKVPYIKKETATVPPLEENKPEAVIGSVTYIDDTTGKTLSTATIAGGIGEKITYTTTATITKYENEGYDFVSSNFVNGDEVFEKTGNKFEVHFKHGIEPINPNHPGKPGEPLNPDDPNGNGPKYPAGTDEKSLNKTVTRTITYVGAGDKTPKEVVQSVNFTASGELDKVTGKWIKELTWTPDQSTLASVSTPVVASYHVVSVSADSKDGVNVDSISVNHDSKDSKVIVVYAENGHIIPVDPNGKPIKNVPTPPYTTDPHNPAKVVPNEPVPEIPGYTPTQSTVTPPNPGEDTPVIYVPTTPTTPTDPNPTPEPHPEPNPDTDVPDIPAPEVPSVDVPMPHPQTPEVPEEPDETPAPHATTPETPVSEDEGEVPVVHASEVKDNDDVPMPHAAQETLPQTGEKTSVMAVIAGAFASVLGIFGLASRRKEDK
ncbi:YSIRK-type signal peptide-containing protein [Lactobacillus rodentium]|uniref:Gram-positive cocci surface proteins LPxTG domain-containing protein n=1 Tax=Lactobacillus rodentium TaxID=947835 RepID=A0A2Z6T6C6_9LACO|nr:YSIRK-type signal peptide-containing protein [Lactobacillus rodentium]MCR1893858.1 YSIRK-type signal peptide-containing protein [Lactobacillus rodentium]GBG04276.1 hypothetical protein LrDSM24759_01900 [Lactobacillus rodentium]